MKAKFVGKVKLIVSGFAYEPGNVYEIKDELSKTYPNFFDIIETPKPKPAPKAKPKAKTED